MSGELVGWKDGTTFLSYTEKFKQARRYFSQVMGTKSIVKNHHELIEVENRKFLRRLLQTPEHVHEHIRKYIYLAVFSHHYLTYIRLNTEWQELSS